jgi:ribosomal-protein-alanine N-acetyltransferase
MYIFRYFQETDVASVMRLVLDTLNEFYESSLYLTLHNVWKEGFIVAESGGELVGFILGVNSAPKEARILILTVLDDHRKKGIGGTLLKTFIKECYAKNLNIINLEVRVENEEAIQFYNRHGFTIVRTLIDYYTEGKNAYQMQKIL